MLIVNSWMLQHDSGGVAPQTTRWVGLMGLLCGNQS